VWKKLVRDVDAPTYPHLCEIIRGGYACKPHLDLDYVAPDAPDAPDARVQTALLPAGCGSVHDVVQRTQQLVRAVFRDDYGVDPDAWLPDDAFVWLYSSNPAKMSLHLIIDTSTAPANANADANASHPALLLFRSNHTADDQGAARLAESLAERDPEGLGLLVDRSIYTHDRPMRLMGATKFRKDASSRFVPLFHARDRATFMRSIISVAPADEITTADHHPHRIIRVPPRKYVPAARATGRSGATSRNAAAQSSSTLGRQVAADRPLPPSALDGRILELVRTRAPQRASRQTARLRRRRARPGPPLLEPAARH
jgi:aromatic ring-cleaving dioxygenase